MKRFVACAVLVTSMCARADIDFVKVAYDAHGTNNERGFCNACVKMGLSRKDMLFEIHMHALSKNDEGMSKKALKDFYNCDESRRFTFDIESDKDIGYSLPTLVTTNGGSFVVGFLGCAALGIFLGFQRPKAIGTGAESTDD